MKRILLDQGLAPRAASLLRASGWDAVHISEVGMDRAEDSEVLEYARRDDRVCITAELIRVVWRACESAIEKGAAVSVDVSSIRIRELPLR